MVFADAYRFSKLSEQQMPAFIREFMGPIAALANRTKPAPAYQNTWGTEYFSCSPKPIARRTLRSSLTASLAGRDWTGGGIFPPTSVSGSHCTPGPVYRFKDKITRQMNYLGSPRNRAARIEPVTPPGQIYASNAFAASGDVDGPR